MSDAHSHVSSLESRSLVSGGDSGDSNSSPRRDAPHSTRGVIVFGVVAVLLMLITGVSSVLAEHHIDPLQVTLTHGALIVDTPYSSFIADSHGVALAAAPYACGIDDFDGAWCSVAMGMSVNQ